MFIPCLQTSILVAFLCRQSASAHSHQRRGNPERAANASEHVGHLNIQALAKVAPSIPLVSVNNDELSLKTNTSIVLLVDATLDAVKGETIDNTALIIARDTDTAYSAYSGLNDRGIPYSVLVVPSTGRALPRLNSSISHGNFGLIVVMSEVSYDYGSSEGFRSALTPAQWQTLYDYQVAFGVRMVRLDVAPSASTGTSSLGACCLETSNQLVSISNSSAFPGAGLKVGAGVTTQGLYHYPAQIIDPTIAVEIAQFSASEADGLDSTTTAAVINNIDGHQQMVFFLPFATQWSLASNFLQHAWVHWATRGLYIGYRRATLSTQVDDMFLETPMFDTGKDFRITGADLAHHITAMNTINERLPAGSKWMIEIGHNGNGNIEKSDDIDDGNGACSPGPIEYPDQIDTPLEYSKPLGSGTSIWPKDASAYGNYSANCMKKDALLTWWQKASNLNAFSHLTHTFSHQDQDNATYSDVSKEIAWNKGWLAAAGISAATKFSSTGLIPPAITGLHNGDALRAWADNKIVHVVGDNTRPVLLNMVNEHWPLITTVAANGYAGIQVSPRWASNIYYNCNYADCIIAEWKAVSNGSGDIYDVLAIEQETNVRHLLGLHHDPFMFHQANLMYVNADSYSFDDENDEDDDGTVMSLLEVWVDRVTREYARLFVPSYYLLKATDQKFRVSWPLISQKHDDIAAGFSSRMARDQCQPMVTWQIDNDAKTITGVTVSCKANTCSVPIPVTFPGTVVNQQGATVEQIGSDPLTLWVTMPGTPVDFTLTKPIML